MFTSEFSNDLESYLIKISTPESALLKQLREETQAISPVAHMLCGPLEGRLLALLVKLSKATRVLELGTFTGYSALHMASALPANGQLITCEIREDHAAIAQRYFDKCTDGSKITLCMGEAAKIIPTLKDNFDFMFVDADKANYPLYYDLLITKLLPGGLMLVDNALWRGEVVQPESKEAVAIDKLNQKASLDPNVETVLLPIRDGLLLILKKS